MEPRGPSWRSWAACAMAAASLAAGCGADAVETERLHTKTRSEPRLPDDPDASADASRETGTDTPVPAPPPPAASDGGIDGTPPPLDVNLGARCTSDLDCDVPLICLQQDRDNWRGGGPQNGYCSLSCADAPQICQRLTTDALCVRGSDDAEAYCFEACFNGLTDTKCPGRPELACTRVPDGLGSYCAPSCGNDDDCGERYCDLGSGVCVATAPAGLPVGAKCDVTNDECAGLCQPLGSFAFCSGVCTVGDATSCGVAESPAPRGAPACVTFLDVEDTAGDSGLCLQRCDCDGDCRHADAKCRPMGTPAGEERWGAKGFCWRRRANDEAGGIPCPRTDPG